MACAPSPLWTGARDAANTPMPAIAAPNKPIAQARLN
jgi:hypothetical protein